MCEAVIKANDTVPRLAGPTKILPFSSTDICPKPNQRAATKANYSTYEPYGPLYDDVTPARGVADLTDDNDIILHICPFCDADPHSPNLLNSRKALLTHLRNRHYGINRIIPPEIQQHFGISLCPNCDVYVTAANTASHVCRPYIIQNEILPPSIPNAPVCLIPPSIPKPDQLMTQPSQITDELVDALTAISFDEIFRFPARTITQIHYSSVKMWSQALSLVLNGIIIYSYGGLNDEFTSKRAQAFLKLFLLLPRLLLSSSRGVAERARHLLTGKKSSFDYLMQKTIIKSNFDGPKKNSDAYNITKKHKRITELIKHCDLSRALNTLESTPPLHITDDLNRRIIELHPEAEEEHIIPESAPVRIRIAADETFFSEHELLRVIKDLKIHAAPDMTGLRPNHIKCLFRGLRELDSAEMTCRQSLYRLIHLILQDPTQFGPDDFWRHFAGGKLSVIPQASKPRPVGTKNVLYKIITSIIGRKHDKDLVDLAGPAHLSGKSNGVLAAALMTQMEIDYMTSVPHQIRAILTTDAEAAFQSASRRHCYQVLCSEPILRERLAPFFAHTHKGSQRIFWPATKQMLKPSSGFTQGDVNASKMFTINTASLVSGLQAVNPNDATVVAIVDDITIMGTIEAIVDIESARAPLQLPANYIVNRSKQFVYTPNETHVEEIQQLLPEHTIIHLAYDKGLNISGIPIGGDGYVKEKLQSNLDKTKEIISSILSLDSVQEKLVLLLTCIPGRMHHLLGAVPLSLSRHFASQYDDAITSAIAEVLDLGTLTQRDKLLMQRKLSNHGLGLRSMETNLEFLFLAGFMKTAKLIMTSFPQFRPILAYTLEGESGYGLQLAEALSTLRDTDNPTLLELLPESLSEATSETYTWQHDAIQRELDGIVSRQHELLYDLTRIGDQQDKATLLSMDTSIFCLIPRSPLLQIPNSHLLYLAKQLFGRPQRRYARKFCPNISSAGHYCGVQLDSRDLHLRTCKMNPIHHHKHAAIHHWFQELAKQAHIATAPAPPITETSPSHPTRPLAADLMLIDVSLKEPGRDGQALAIDFSVISPAAETYCGRSASEPLYAAGTRESLKIAKYARAYKELDNIHFEPFVLESGGVFGKRAQHVFSRICCLITQSSGQSGSAIAYFWKSRLLVTLAAITFNNAQRWAQAHNRSCTPDSVTQDLMDYYDYDENDQKRIRHGHIPSKSYHNLSDDRELESNIGESPSEPDKET